MFFDHTNAPQEPCSQSGEKPFLFTVTHSFDMFSASLDLIEHGKHISATKTSEKITCPIDKFENRKHPHRNEPLSQISASKASSRTDLRIETNEAHISPHRKLPTAQTPSSKRTKNTYLHIETFSKHKPPHPGKTTPTYVSGGCSAKSGVTAI